MILKKIEWVFLVSMITGGIATLNSPRFENISLKEEFAFGIAIFSIFFMAASWGWMLRSEQPDLKKDV